MTCKINILKNTNSDLDWVRKNALNRPFSFFLIIFSCLIISTPSFSATTIKITPEITELPSVGETITINVAAENIADMGAFDFSIDYDPAIVIIDGDSSVNLSSALLNSGKTYIIANLGIDNNAGKIQFAAYSLGSTPGPGGSVCLADITFTVQKLVNSSLILQDVTLMNSLGNPYFDILQNNGQIVIIHSIVTLLDAISVLQILCGITPDNGTDILDVNNDSKIGIEEVIYILQTVSGNRENITCN